MEPVQAVFCQRITLLRADLQLKKQEFAEKVGIEHMRYLAIEEGEPCTIDELQQIASACCVSCDYLVGLDNRRTMLVDGFTDSQFSAVQSVCDTISEMNKRVSQVGQVADDVEIQSCGFTPRIINALSRNGITTVKQLLQKTPAELGQIRNLGNNSITMIIEWQEKTRLASGIIMPAQLDNNQPAKKTRGKKKRKHRHFVERQTFGPTIKGALLKAGIRTEKEFMALDDAALDSIDGIGIMGKFRIKELQKRLTGDGEDSTSENQND